MLSRRELFAAGLTAGASILVRSDTANAAAPQPRTKVLFDVPKGSCDCAVHVFDPQRHPYWEGRTYTPEPATVVELRTFLGSLRLDRVVVVQGTPYGVDNSCVVQSVRDLGSRGRGVAIIDQKTSPALLDEMHRAGVRGIRLNVGNIAATDPAAARQRLKTVVEQLKMKPDWSIQLSASTATYDVLRDDLEALPLVLVVDHFGEVRTEEGVKQPGFEAILNLLKSGKAYVKISNADNLTRRADLSDLTPFATALIAANPQRVVWGTAWPHPTAGNVPGRKATDLALHRQIDDGRAINMLPVWAPDAAVRRMILVENPARLYGFEGS